jgi:hypothetical protein
MKVANAEHSASPTAMGPRTRLARPAAGNASASSAASEFSIAPAVTLPVAAGSMLVNGPPAEPVKLPRPDERGLLMFTLGGAQTAAKQVRLLYHNVAGLRLFHGAQAD